MTTETKSTRQYIKHTYAEGLSKEEKAKQRRALRASLKAAAQPPAPQPEPEITPTPEPAPEPEIEVQAETTPTIEATKENLKQALNRRDKKKQKAHK